MHGQKNIKLFDPKLSARWLHKNMTDKTYIICCVLFCLGVNPGLSDQRENVV